MRIYGIVGTFFQAGKSLGIVHGAESEGGTHVEVQHQAASHAFSGHFGIQEGYDYGGGNMLDEFGPSRITVTLKGEDEMTFEKHYQGRPMIWYSLKKREDGIWDGTYENPELGTGIARCKLIELDESMFNINPSEPGTAWIDGTWT